MVIGGPPEHRGYWSGPYKSVIIGDDCFISNGVTIDSGTEQNTVVGNNVTLLRQSHVGHDAVIEDHVNISCSVLIGGHTVVMFGANIGLNASIHQHQLIGPLAMVGMGGVVTKQSTVEPFYTYIGTPVRKLRRNDVGIERSQLTAYELHRLEQAYAKRFLKLKS